MSDTNNHEKSHNILELSIEQQKALGLILTGLSDEKVAGQVGVVRETVTRWRLYHPVFLAELNRARLEMWKDSHDRLLKLVPRALDVLEREIDCVSCLKCAVEVLKASRMYGNTEYKMPTETDPETIIDNRAREIKTQKSGNIFFDNIFDQNISEDDRAEAVEAIRESIEG